jgi:NAD(P)-dependent dehydrogenase (short-subunit alcohol dehydrogenase family)
MAQECSPEIHVNTIAIGFFVTDQNRRLLLNEDGSLTLRGKSILDHTHWRALDPPTSWSSRGSGWFLRPLPS